MKPISDQLLIHPKIIELLNTDQSKLSLAFEI